MLLGEEELLLVWPRGSYSKRFPSTVGIVGGAKSQDVSIAPPPKGITSATRSGHNRLYALSNRQEAEASPDVITGML